MKRALLVVTLAVAACKPAPSVPAGDTAVFKAATAALDKRLAAIRDYRFEGTASHKETGKQLAITYAFMQPQFAKGTLGNAQTVIFDGQRILALEHTSKTYGTVDKSAGDQALLLALHNAFAEFACEGWRPPLVKPKGTSARTEGEHWVLTTAIDDAQLKEEVLVLRAKDGAFVEKRTIDKAGTAIAVTKVLEELTDPATGLALPKRWQRTNAGGTFEVALTKATVNAGMAREDFTTTVPEGYKPAS